MPHIFWGFDVGLTNLLQNVSTCLRLHVIFYYGDKPAEIPPTQPPVPEK